jgi:hypothetical protein
MAQVGIGLAHAHRHGHTLAGMDECAGLSPQSILTSAPPDIVEGRPAAETRTLNDWIGREAARHGHLFLWGAGIS